MLNETFSVIFKHCVAIYYFSNVASNKILLSFLMTIEVWKDDCLTFAWCFCIAWRTGSWCTEITRGEGPNQQHSNNFIFRSIISFPLGIWFNLLKAAIIMPGAKMKLHLGMYYVVQKISIFTPKTSCLKSENSNKVAK